MRAAARFARGARVVTERTSVLRAVATHRQTAAIVGSLVVLAVALFWLPGPRLLLTQLLYIPILVAAGTWGFGPSLLVGLLASAEALFPTHAASVGSAIVQPLLFLGFAAVSTSVLRAFRPVERGHGAVKADATGPAGSERVLESLARTVEVRDRHTQGHCRRVAKNARVLGRALGLSAEELDLLRWSALLHDIGKIAVPEYILMKNGRLSEGEYDEIRRHPSYGADLLVSVSQSYRPIADVVRAHHERWDGLGYPLGYRASEIPQLARIIAIVDVFEALTSERPYRSPMPVAQALKYVMNGAGTQFDPAIVPVFEELVVSGRIECGAYDSDVVIRSPLPKEATAHLQF